MSNTIEMTFTTGKKLLSLMGVYPSQDDSVFTNVKKFTFYFTFLVLPVMSTAKRLLVEEISDHQMKNFMIIYLCQMIPFIFKLMSFLQNGQQFKTCVTFFEHPRFIPSGEEERNITGECVSVGQKITTWYLLSIFFGLSAIFFLPAFVGNLTIYMTRAYPKTYSSQYWLMCLAQFTCVIYQAYSGTAPDAIIGGLLYLAAGQLRILKHNLQNLDAPTEQSYKRDLSEWNIVRYENIEKNLKRCIERHLSIMNFVKEFEECFAWPMFYQLSACMFCLCFAFVGLLMASSGTDTIPALLGGVFSVSQLFFYCFFGTLLEEEMSTLNDSIYMGYWYRYDLRIRKALIIMMEYSKQPMIVTAGKVIPLTLTSFVSVVKSSYSMIAVFRDLSS